MEHRKKGVGIAMDWGRNEQNGEKKNEWNGKEEMGRSEQNEERKNK